MQSSTTGPAARPIPVMPARPARRLSTFRMLRTAVGNSITAFDEELYGTLVVPRRYVHQRVVFCSDPEGIRHVLLDNAGNYARMSGIRRIYEVEIGTGTLASAGETWRRHRRVAIPATHHRAFQTDIPALIALAERAADALEAERGRVVNIERVGIDLITGMFNHILTGGRPDTGALLDWLSRIPRPPSAIDLIPKPRWMNGLIRNSRGEETAPLDRQLRALITERLEPGYAGAQDLLWRLAHGVDRRTGESLPVAEVRDEAASIAAGGAATIRGFTWLWYLVALHPEVATRLHGEVRQVLGDAPITPEALGQLPYARQVIDETLRLYPPVPAIIRENVEPDVVCGARLPRRGIVAILPWVLHRHRRLWQDPDLFDPDRFAPGNKASQPRYAYLPFSTGPSVCFGASLAMTEMLVAVAVLARRFRFELVPDRPIEPVGRLTLRPRGGLSMQVRGCPR